jgi:hypothetical protein
LLLFLFYTLQLRFKVRIVTSRAYHALFMHNMLIRPSREELASFGEPDFVIYNGGAFPANKVSRSVSDCSCCFVCVLARTACSALITPVCRGACHERLRHLPSKYGDMDFLLVFFCGLASTTVCSA